MSSEWQQQIQRIRDQVVDLNQTLDQTDNLTVEQRKVLQSGTSQLRDLVCMPEDVKGLLGELPKILKTLFSNSSFGAGIVGQDGEWLLFNSLVRTIFGASLNGSSLTIGERGVQFLDSERRPIAEADLPWRRSLIGENVQEQEIILLSADQKGEVWLQVTSTPLLDGNNQPGGAVVLLLDRTEMVTVANRIQDLQSQLEKQLQLVESAESALRKLSDKLGIQQPGAAKDDQANKQTSAAAAVKSNILVVDDMPVNQRLLLLQLKKLGCTADTANNGREAVEAAARKQYDLIFMDCDMPVMDGYEATRTIRKAEESSNRYTPIVAMTSLDRESDRERCLASGMDGYLNKGVDARAFTEVMTKYVPGLIDERRPKPEQGERALPHNGQTFSLDNLRSAFDQDELQDIVTLFMGSSSTLASCMDFAISDKDVKGLGHFAYSLKGPAATMQMHAISRLCAEVTASAERGDWDSARRRHTMLVSELSAVQNKLHDFVRQGFVADIASRT